VGVPATTVGAGITATVLVGVVLVALSRSPYLLLHGRLHAEEGTSLFAHMLAEPGPASLVFVPARTGYLILFADGATWLAAHGPLGVAPLVTAWLSLGVLVTLVAIVLRWPSDLLTTVVARLAAVALLVVGTGAVAEVWLTSINTTTFGIIALVLLFVRFDDLSRRQVAVAFALLALAGLSGIYAAALAPLFIVTALRARSRRRWSAAAIVSGAATIQVLLVLRADRSGTLADARSASLSLDELVRSVGGLHLGGFAFGSRAIDQLGNAIEDRSVLAAVLVGVTVLVLGAVLVAIVWRAPDRRVPVLLVGAFVIIEAVVHVGSLTRGAPGRYAVVPVTIITFLLLYGATALTDRWVVRGATALLAVALVAGMVTFWTGEPKGLRCSGCPDWRADIEAWESGGSGEIRIWPYDGEVEWIVVIPEDRRPGR